MPDSREKLAAWLNDLAAMPDWFLIERGCITSKSLTLGDLRALLAEPTPVIAIPISDALRQVEAALQSYVQPEGICECQPCVQGRSAILLLPALAQQMVEGERKYHAYADKIERALGSLTDQEACMPVADIIARRAAELTRTREALTVAEGALRSLALANRSAMADFVPRDGMLMCTWSVRDALSRATDIAEIAALSHTGTPKGEAE